MSAGVLSTFALCDASWSKESFQIPPCPAVSTRQESVRQNASIKPITLEKSQEQKAKHASADRVQKVNILPLALIQSEAEQEEQMRLGLDAERHQLTELWSATIARSEDIKFVLTSLQPSSDPKHTASTTMKYVSGALFNVLQSAPMMLPSGSGSMPAKIGAGLGGNMLSSLFGQHQNESANISREQGCILYTMIRNIADKLVDHYRNYRRSLDEYEVARIDLHELQDLVAQAGSGWGAADQIQFEYTIRKSRREARSCAEKAALHRLHLSDLAGTDAVRKLDEDIFREKEALAKLIDIPASPLHPVPTESAQDPAKRFGTND